MGFIDDKTQVIDNVALFEVLGNLPKGRTTSSLASVKSKDKNLLTYLIDILSVTCKDNAKSPVNKNKCEATKILIDILTEFFVVLTRILKEGIIEAIKAGLACSVDFKLPVFNPSIGQLKVKMGINNLDLLGLTMIDPLSSVGSTFYGKDATKDFNWFLNNLIQSSSAGGWPASNPILDLNVIQSTNEIEIGINHSYVSSHGTTGSGSTGSGKSFNDFIKDYVNSIEMITLETFMARLTDRLTGAMTNGLKKVQATAQNPYALAASLDHFVSLEQISMLQEKINSSDPCKEDYQIDNSYFTFTNDEQSKIEDLANQKYNGGANLDLGCGIVSATVDPATVKSVFDDIRNTPPSKVSVVIQNSIDTLNNSLTSNVPDTDKKVAKLSLNAQILHEIPKVLTNIILEPKIVALYHLCEKLVNGPLTPPPLSVGSTNVGNINNVNINVTNPFDFAKATKVFFEYVSRKALSALLEIIFNEVKKEVIKLVTEQVIKIIKEKAKIRIKSISSIVTGKVNDQLTTITQSVNTTSTV